MHYNMKCPFLYENTDSLYSKLLSSLFPEEAADQASLFSFLRWLTKGQDSLSVQER